MYQDVVYGGVRIGIPSIVFRYGHNWKYLGENVFDYRVIKKQLVSLCIKKNKILCSFGSHT